MSLFGKKKPEDTIRLCKNDLRDVNKIKDILDPEEKVLIVAKQGRLKPRWCPYYS